MVQASPPPTPQRDQDGAAIRGKIGKASDQPGRYPLLELVWGRLVQRLPRKLTAIYAVPVEVRLRHRGIIRFASALDDLPQTSLFCVFEAREWGSSGLVVIDPILAQANLELLLGSDDVAPAEADPRSVTAVDRVLTRRLAEAVLGELAAAFRHARAELGSIAMSCSRLETSPRSAAIADPHAMTVVARLQVEIGASGSRGQIGIVMPMAMFDPIRPFLTAPHCGEAGTNDFAWARRICHGLMEMPLPLEVELERLCLPFHTVMDWSVGDLLPLSADANAVLSVRIDGQGAMLTGRLGASRGRRAVKIKTNDMGDLGAPLARLARQLGVPEKASPDGNAREEES